MMPHTQGICRINVSKRRKVTLTESSIGSSIFLASNKTPSSPPYGPISKVKSQPEEKSDYELPAVNGDDDSLSPFFIYGDL